MEWKKIFSFFHFSKCHLKIELNIIALWLCEKQKNLNFFMMKHFRLKEISLAVFFGVLLSQTFESDFEGFIKQNLNSNKPCADGKYIVIRVIVYFIFVDIFFFFTFFYFYKVMWETIVKMVGLVLIFFFLI